MSEDQRYDELIGEALRDARSIQNFLWAEEAQVYNEPFDPDRWYPLFQKRVDRIGMVQKHSPHWKVEVRKRLLQQASLSLRAIIALNETK